MSGGEALRKKIEEKARSLPQGGGSHFSFSCLSDAVRSKLYSTEEVKRSADLDIKSEMIEGKSSTVLDKITFPVSPASFRDMKTEENENTPHMTAEGRDLILRYFSPPIPLRETSPGEYGENADSYVDECAEVFALDLGRKQDQVILEAFFGAATTTNKKTVEFPKFQCVAGDERGLTIEKIIKARAKLPGANNSHREELYLAVTAEEETELLKLCVENSEVRTLATMDGVNLKSILGFKVIHVPRDESNKHRISAWLKSGMHFGIYWGDDVINVSIDDKCTPLCFYDNARWLARCNTPRRKEVRGNDEKKSVEIKTNNKSPVSD